ncbi:50S ribosomal protein L25 [Cloacibacillus evryensis]|uniref:Large ribosomal subunit protein bL25 n=1 Tax=Cloacibacillus evryensis TaxID=508460 RepID=A0AAW5K4S5_9BACT|nr:50S ribosomal protein L25 [Cloacibacillus evryensis]EHL67921.1 ribosomal protein L25, Ctc-form [Synergistes sp. 3_1_syn1]MCQ4815427.1 50S ribosomal protein L25 [Cloacibacillus evryensis]
MAKNQTVKLDFTKREVTGTGVCRKIRSKNLIPVVLYGPDYKSGLAGTVAAKTIAPVANGGHRETTLIELTIDDGTTASALIRDVQRHPLTRQIRHIDLYQVLKGHKVKVEIPVRVANAEASKGVKEGGLLTHAARLILVEVQPSDIPEEIVVDAKDLEMGSEVFVKDLDVPEGVTVLTDPEILVLHISAIRSSDDETEEGEEESKEVEVVAKGKAAKEEE